MSRRKFSGGEPFQVHHADHNRWQAAGDYIASRFGGSAGAQLDHDEQTGIIMVKNTTALSLPRFSILALNGSVFDPTFGSDVDSFKNQVVLKGEMPSSTYSGRFCVLQLDARPDEIVPAMVSGVTPCLLKITATSDTYADAEVATSVDDRTRYLKTGSTGAAQILFKPEDETGEHLGVVRLSNKPASGTRIVTPKTYLYAAFGGGESGTNNNLDYGNVESNALAISTGNYIPLSSGSTATQRNRIVYPGLCYVWEFDSNGVLQKTDEEIYCVNLTGLPIMKDTWCLARQVQSSQYPVVTKLGEFSRAGKKFTFDQTAPTPVQGLEGKILRGNITAHETPENTAYYLHDFAHADSTTGDVFIHHPGTYTLHICGFLTRYNSPYSDLTEWTDSNGDTIDLPNPVGARVGLLLNYQPGAGVEVSSAYGVDLCVPAQFNGVVMAERTAKITHTLDNWHGQPYMRLSMACHVTEYEGDPADAQVEFYGEVYIRPEGGGQEGGNEGTGYNAFLGSSGSFQWWGGGDPPVDFDEDGNEI